MLGGVRSTPTDSKISGSGACIMRYFFVSLILALSSTVALAQSTGSQGYFQIHNDTGNNILIGFYTNDGSGWSSNWLSEEIGPNGSVAVEFIADTGSCDQLFQAGWLGDDNATEILDEPFSIDICEASNVYLGDNDITFD